MKRYLSLIVATMVLLLLLFFAAEALHVPLLTEPSSSLATLGPFAAPVSVLLLIADVVLPVPSSLVMIANGALFGVVPGALLNLVGTVGAGLFAFLLGRRGRRLLVRWIAPAERARAERLIDRWGELGIALTRAVPILAETVALVAGTSAIGWWRMALATFIGALPVCVLYAMIGASVVSLRSIVPWLVLLFVFGLFWLARRLRSRVADTNAARRS